MRADLQNWDAPDVLAPSGNHVVSDAAQPEPCLTGQILRPKPFRQLIGLTTDTPPEGRAGDRYLLTAVAGTEPFSG